MDTKASLFILKADASPRVKAAARPLMWSVTSSELALQQHMGLQECGKKAVWKRREEVCIYLCWWGMILDFDLTWTAL